MTEAVQENTTQTEDTVSLSIVDLANIRQIINVASQRGAFRANELETVGSIYNRLDAFVTRASANNNAASSEETKDETPSEE